MEKKDPETEGGATHAVPAVQRTTVGARAWDRTFAALHIPGYRWYWMGTAASFMGMQMQWPAQSWLAYELTGSAFLLGLVSAAWGTPMFVLSLFGGVLADRMEKKQLMVLSQAAMGAVNLVLAVLISFDLIQFWHLLAAATFSGAVFAFNMPARQAIIPALVPRNMLFNAITLSSGVMNATRVLGPALAGVLMAFIGIEGAFYAAVANLLLAVALLARLPATGTGKGTRKVSREIVEGLRYIRGRSLVLILLGMAMVTVLFGMPYQNLMPVFAELLNVEELGFGFLMAMTGIGALVGSLAIANLGDYKRKGMLLMLSGIGFGVALVAFANVTSLYPALLILMAVGAASTGFMSVNNTLIQMHISDDVRGRVMSVYMMTFGLMPLGTLPFGAIAQRYGAPLAVTIGGGLLAAVVLALMVLRRQLWRLE